MCRRLIPTHRNYTLLGNSNSIFFCFFFFFLVWRQLCIQAECCAVEESSDRRSRAVIRSGTHFFKSTSCPATQSASCAHPSTRDPNFSVDMLAGCFPHEASAVTGRKKSSEPDTCHANSDPANTERVKNFIKRFSPDSHVVETSLIMRTFRLKKSLGMCLLFRRSCIKVAEKLSFNRGEKKDTEETC